MKGSEKQVLNVIKEMDAADKKSIAFKLVVPVEYVTQICSILSKDGYIEENPDGKFKLTLTGKKLIAPIEAKKPLIKL